jgi:hypothetical protein
VKKNASPSRGTGQRSQLLREAYDKKGFEQKNNTRDSNVVPHRSTNLARRCLTSQSGRDAVLSSLYGRSCRLTASAQNYASAWPLTNSFCRSCFSSQQAWPVTFLLHERKVAGRDRPCPRGTPPAWQDLPVPAQRSGRVLSRSAWSSNWRANANLHPIRGGPRNHV